jgi:hypothetical protein
MMELESDCGTFTDLDLFLSMLRLSGVRYKTFTPYGATFTDVIVTAISGEYGDDKIEVRFDKNEKLQHFYCYTR